MKNFVLLLLCVTIFGISNASAMGEHRVKSSSEFAQLAPEFTLETTKGERLSLSQVRGGKKAIIFFWATWCPHCHEAIMVLDRNKETIAQEGIELILVDEGESREEVKAFFEHNGLTFESFLDEDNSLQEPYGIVGVPTFFFLDESGKIHHSGNEFPENYKEMFQ